MAANVSKRVTDINKLKELKNHAKRSYATAGLVSQKSCSLWIPYLCIVNKRENFEQTFEQSFKKKWSWFWVQR